MARDDLWRWRSPLRAAEHVGSAGRSCWDGGMTGSLPPPLWIGTGRCRLSTCGLKDKVQTYTSTLAD